MNNFEQAIKKAIIEYFNQAEIKYSESDSFNSIFHQYMSTLDKWVKPQKYIVHLSNQLQNRMSTDTELNEKILFFKNLFQNGQNINGHQSRKIYEAEYYDKLLMLWDIHHLHLNCTSANSDAEMRHNRSETLLFIMVRDNDAYFIDVESHNRAHVFSMFRLLEIIQDNWEFLLYKHTNINDISYVADDEALNKLFKANISYFIFKIKDGFYSVGTNAQTMAGTSLNNQLAYNQLQKCLRHIYPQPPIYPQDIKCILHHSKNYFCDLQWKEGNKERFHSIKSK